jgi:hypothetical protein
MSLAKYVPHYISSLSGRKHHNEPPLLTNVIFFSFQPCESYTSFTRSLTFPKCGSFRAQKRLRQVEGHLVPKITRASTLVDMGSEKTKMERKSGDAVDVAGDKCSETHRSDLPITPELPEVPAGFKRCPICKTDTPTAQIGNLDGEIVDKYNQLGPLPAPSPPLKRHPDFRHFMPPDSPDHGNFSLFTAGSIEMGAAVQWQQLLIEHLQDLPITITNPRRGTWDPAVNAKREDPAFFSQVEWELDALTQADVICYFFDCNTVSPVSLMELGIWSNSGKIIVCCDQRYWRQGNVEIVCERYNIPYVSSFKYLVPALKVMMQKKGLKLDDKGNFAGERKLRNKSKPGVPKEDRWWLEFQDSEEEKWAKLTKKEQQKKLEQKAKTEKGSGAAA